MSMKELKIGVVGNGVVGKATARAFLEHVSEVRVYDCVDELRTHTYNEVMLCDIIMLCLPEKEVERHLRVWCSNPQANLVIRSTVPVGLTLELTKRNGFINLVHWPEFLTARCSLTDAQLPARNIIGIPPFEEDAAIYRMSKCGMMLMRLLRDRFPGCPIHLMTSDESETVKLATNSLFAAKVALFNELHAFCEKKGMNWDRVLKGILADGRISHSHTQVPGPDGKYGFGGTCLPKDLEQLIKCISQTQSSLCKTQDELMAAPDSCPVLKSVRQRNKYDRQRSTDSTNWSQL